MTTHDEENTTPEEREAPIPGVMPAYSSNSEALSEREMELVRRLSEYFPTLTLETAVMPVHTVEGGEVETLRFTLSGLASADLHRDDIAGGDTAALASKMEMQLRDQLPVNLEEEPEPDAFEAARAGPQNTEMPSTQMVHDPVCHMDIKLDDAYGRSTQHGFTYYFCSQSCKQRFDADPDSAVAAEAAAHGMATA